MVVARSSPLILFFALLFRPLAGRRTSQVYAQCRAGQIVLWRKRNRFRFAGFSDITFGLSATWSVIWTETGAISSVASQRSAGVWRWTGGSIVLCCTCREVAENIRQQAKRLAFPGKIARAPDVKESRHAKMDFREAVRPAYLTSPGGLHSNSCAKAGGRDLGFADPCLRDDRYFLDPGDPGNRPAPRRIEGVRPYRKRRRRRVILGRAVRPYLSNGTIGTAGRFSPWA